MKQENRDRVICAMGIIRAIKDMSQEPIVNAMNDALGLLGATLVDEDAVQENNTEPED